MGDLYDNVLYHIFERGPPLPPDPPFSERHGFHTPKEISIWEDAPENLRYEVSAAAGRAGWSISDIRDVVCQVLRTRPDRDNWSGDRIQIEVEGLIDRCEWFKVYDIIEALYAHMAENNNYARRNPAQEFASSLNAFFVDEGIGWQLTGGRIVTRGNDLFESAVQEAADALKDSGRPTAATHLQESREDLSRRPHADLSGAVFHAMGALECVARDVSGDAKGTLGEIIKRNAELFPKPVDSAVSQLWGYASEQARHVKEGTRPQREEAELVVGLSATLSTYLVRKLGSSLSNGSGRERDQ